MRTARTWPSHPSNLTVNYYSHNNILTMTADPIAHNSCLMGGSFLVAVSYILRRFDFSSST